jgi:YihY family inner membrane protein
MSSRPAERGVRAALDRWQQRHAAVAFAVAVARKFADDRASSLAALVAYYAFFSIFPLLLVFVSVLGFVLDNDPELRADIVDSTLARLPVIGPQVAGEIDPLTGSTVALIVGLGGALWAGLGVTVALERAFDAVWDVPRFEQRDAIRARARGLLVLSLVGLLLIGSTALAGAGAGGAIGPAAGRIGAVAMSLAGNALLYFVVFGLLTARPLRPGELMPGVVLAAVGTLALQTLGAWYVEATIDRASATYGTFALVIGLLSWLLLVAHVMLVAAEVNVVRRRRLWPRSLGGPLKPADREVMRRAALAARSDARATIDVRFANTPGVPAPPPAHKAASLSPAMPRPRIDPAHGSQQRSAGMSTLVAIAYPDVATAEQVRQELIQATKEHILRLDDAVVVEHQADGKIKLHQAMSTAGTGAAGGALWGGLIGLIFLAPLLGMAVGAATGALAGKASDVGVNDNFMKELGEKIPPGAAALIALGSTDARDKVIERLRSYGGDLIQTSLSGEEEERLRASIGAEASA